MAEGDVDLVDDQLGRRGGGVEGIEANPLAADLGDVTEAGVTDDEHVWQPPTISSNRSSAPFFSRSREMSWLPAMT
ncbi:hypothetical protein NKK48_01110 [Mesorhizobium sp. C386A]|uniref:hypothetical protein n=1 Tax=Mesorhizobium sp. C386A TaxID=2956831 RepID=UPI00333D3786